MSGLIGHIIWAATNIAIGFNGLPWPWCLLLAALGIPLYYSMPKISILLHNGLTLFLSDLRRGGIKWLLWVYLSHLPASFLLYALGRSANAVL